MRQNEIKRDGRREIKERSNKMKGSKKKSKRSREMTIGVLFLAPKVRNKIDSGFNRWCQNVKKYSPCKGETMNCA
ncbi:MAG: hypothetical protein ACRC10_08165, partial [Thermoguttaceae bacterium]